jgi:hypothetical protein
MHATGKFKVTSWDEKPVHGDGAKVTHASVEQKFSGDIRGEGSVEWLMCYREDETADFVGLQRVAGQVGERSGSFVLQTVGSFDGSEAKGDWKVVPGSGSGELQGLSGEGGFSAPLGSEGTIMLDYEVE